MGFALLLASCRWGADGLWAAALSVGLVLRSSWSAKSPEACLGGFPHAGAAPGLSYVCGGRPAHPRHYSLVAAGRAAVLGLLLGMGIVFCMLWLSALVLRLGALPGFVVSHIVHLAVVMLGALDGSVGSASARAAFLVIFVMGLGVGCAVWHEFTSVQSLQRARWYYLQVVACPGCGILGCFGRCRETRWSNSDGRAVPAALHLGGCAYSGAWGIPICNSRCRSCCSWRSWWSTCWGLGSCSTWASSSSGWAWTARQFVTTELERLPWLCTDVVDF